MLILDVCVEPGGSTGLIVRPHPSLGGKAYIGYLSAYGDDRVVVSDAGSIIDAITAADVVITDYSTSGAHAILMDRPVMVINTSGAPFPANDYAALGVAAVATSVADVGSTLARLLAEGWYWPNARSARAAFKDAYNWGGDGQAGDRFLAAVAALPARRPSQG